MQNSMVESLKLEIRPALVEEKSILSNLLELYVHDFSEFVDVSLGADGRFGYQHLDSYWQEPDRYPFLILADAKLAGFALVQKGSAISNESDAWDMAEFFIVRGLRRLGLGKRAARDIWTRLPGKWEVRVIDLNQKALKFWARAIHEFLGESIESVAFEQGGLGRHVFCFHSV
jgi:predicted acetyltransferase